jgi:mRNA-degrading endonuclease RelE of RelBE toxin-antitoxin system
MTWSVRIADNTRLFIESLPDKARRQVSRSISQLEDDPFRGDVKPLQGHGMEGVLSQAHRRLPDHFFRASR